MTRRPYVLVDATPYSVVLACQLCPAGPAQYRAATGPVGAHRAAADAAQHVAQRHSAAVWMQAPSQVRRFEADLLQRIAAGMAHPGPTVDPDSTRTADDQPGRREVPGTVRIPDRGPRGLSPIGPTTGVDTGPLSPRPELPPSLPVVGPPLDRLDP